MFKARCAAISLALALLTAPSLAAARRTSTCTPSTAPAAARPAAPAHSVSQIAVSKGMIRSPLSQRESTLGSTPSFAAAPAWVTPGAPRTAARKAA